MSTRAIASATGTGYGTVARELAGDPNGSPEPNPVTGTDGKTYSPRPRTALNTAHDPDDEVVPGMTAGELDELNVQPRPGPVPADPPKPKRRPLEEQFSTPHNGSAASARRSRTSGTTTVYPEIANRSPDIGATCCEPSTRCSVSSTKCPEKDTNPQGKGITQCRRNSSTRSRSSR